MNAMTEEYREMIRKNMDNTLDSGYIAVVAVAVADGDNISRFLYLPVGYALIGGIRVHDYSQSAL